jgi:Tfp pilus assembly protein FimT
MRKDAGASLLEITVVVAIALVVAALGVPVLWDALQSIHGLLDLVSEVVPR